MARRLMSSNGCQAPPLESEQAARDLRAPLDGNARNVTSNGLKAQSPSTALVCGVPLHAVRKPVGDPVG